VIPGATQFFVDVDVCRRRLQVPLLFILGVRFPALASGEADPAELHLKQVPD